MQKFSWFEKIDLLDLYVLGIFDGNISMKMYICRIF